MKLSLKEQVRGLISFSVGLADKLVNPVLSNVAAMEKALEQATEDMLIIEIKKGSKLDRAEKFFGQRVIVNDCGNYIFGSKAEYPELFDYLDPQEVKS